MGIDSSGNLYVTDTNNMTLRKITPAAAVSTIGGAVRQVGSADGVDTAARFDFPTGIAVDSGGNIYVSDEGNNAIRAGRTPLADVATIDSSTGRVGIVRQLGTSPQTASGWQWSIIRKPRGSTASLSSTSIRNPTFTPDVADLYQFRLVASNGTQTNISTVTLNAASLISGDANGDFTVNVADVFYLINFLFAGGPPPIGPADANGDGTVNVTDIFYLINFLFAGGPAPV